jgi:hypothetical protein
MASPDDFRNRRREFKATHILMQLFKRAANEARFTGIVGVGQA